MNTNSLVKEGWGQRWGLGRAERCARTLWLLQEGRCLQNWGGLWRSVDYKGRGERLGMANAFSKRKQFFKRHLGKKVVLCSPSFEVLPSDLKPLLAA